MRIPRRCFRLSAAGGGTATMSPPIQSSEQGAFVSNMESGMTGDDGRLARPKAMIKPLMIMTLAVALVLGGIFAWQRFTGAMMEKYMGASATAPQTVSTIVAAKMSWQARTRALGSLRAVRGADLAAQASGVVDQIRFESGNEVPAGA